MNTPKFQMIKDLHRKMGYPLGKVQNRVQVLAEKLKEPGSPTRHVRRLTYKATHLRDVLARKAQARRFMENVNPGITPVVKELRAQGFTYFTEQIDPKLMAELNAYYDEVLSKRSETAKSYATHPFFFPLANASDLTTDNILVRFGLQESVLQAVTAYFGCVPFLRGIDVIESRAVKVESARLQASRQWHLDFSNGGDDEVFVWVYLSDVDGLDKGPFTYIPRPSSRKIKNDMFPRRILDEEIKAAGLEEEIKHAFGARSTSFIVDTNKCYHMGSRLEEGQKRVVCIYSFAKPTNDPNIVKVTEPVPEDKKLVVCR